MASPAGHDEARTGRSPLRRRLAAVLVAGALATAAGFAISGDADNGDAAGDRVTAASAPPTTAPVAPADGDQGAARDRSGGGDGDDHPPLGADDTVPGTDPDGGPGAAATEPAPEDQPSADAVTPTGTFTIASGGTDAVGHGPLRTYDVQVEDGIPIAASEFAAEVDRILGDPRSWTADGAVSLRRVDGSSGPASFSVVLATPATTDQLCAPLVTNGIFSCHQGGRAVVNLMRWMEGAEASGLPLPRYREYVVNHEVGHALGHGHVPCPAAGAPAPVMMQQTKGIGACSPNPWPFP